MMLVPPCSTLFPYTTLFRSVVPSNGSCVLNNATVPSDVNVGGNGYFEADNTKILGNVLGEVPVPSDVDVRRDRKSTRLNSSHRCISYAVFCLKKKNKTNNIS